MCSSLIEFLILHSWRNHCEWMFCTQILSRDIRSAVGNTLSQFRVKPLLISLKCLCLFMWFYRTARTTACLRNSFWKKTSQIGGKWYYCSIPVAIPALLQLFCNSLLSFVPLDLINNCWVVIHLAKFFYSSSPLRNILAQRKE